DLLRALEDERADLRERVLLPARHHERPLPRPFAHLERRPLPRLRELRARPRTPEQALHARDRVARVDRAPRLRGMADEDVAVGVEAHHAREEAVTLLVCEHVNTPHAHARDDRVRRAEVDTDDAHDALVTIF